MGIRNHRLLLIQEIRRLGFQVRDLILIQLLNLTTIGIFSFLLQDILIAQPKIGICFFWLTQGSTILLISDRLFNKDLHQGFFDNVLNSSISLEFFIALRWLMFAIVFTGSTILLIPMTLTFLGLNFDFWGYFLLIIFPYNMLTIGYSSLLSLLTHGMKGYLMPILLFPFTIPILILVISGSLGLEPKICFTYLISLILCVFPIIIYLIKFIINKFYDYY